MAAGGWLEEQNCAGAAAVVVVVLHPSKLSLCRAYDPVLVKVADQKILLILI